MISSQYNKRRHNSPSVSLWVGTACLIVAGMMVWGWKPDAWWKEGFMIGAVFSGCILLISNILGNRKLGWIFSFGIIGLMILNRFNILDLLSVVLLVTVLGLITLVN